MNRSVATLVAGLLLLGGTALPSRAQAGSPLFVNLTTDDPHRALMGLSFGANQLGRGHPVTIFLNDRGVFVGSKAQAERFAEHQKILADLVAKGAVILVCPMCSRQYGVAETDLVPGLRVSNPELTGTALFREGTRTLTW